MSAPMEIVHDVYGPAEIPEIKVLVMFTTSEVEVVPVVIVPTAMIGATPCAAVAVMLTAVPVAGTEASVGTVKVFEPVAIVTEEVEVVTVLLTN